MLTLRMHALYHWAKPHTVHPVIAAFLDVGTALDVLSRAGSGAALDLNEQRFATAAKQHPELMRVLASARGRRPSEDAQHAAILLGVRAALSSVQDDALLGPAARAGREALSAAGADAEQIEQLLGGVLVEEAFTGDQDPAAFDTQFVKESFDALPQLATLDSEKVAELTEAFAQSVASSQRPTALACAETLFQSAWGEGPQSINVEHVDESLEALGQGPQAELNAVRGALEALLRFLASKGFIGPLRLERLLAHLEEWTPQHESDDTDDEEDDDEDDDEGSGAPPN
jgi:hypothetical protein